MCTWFVLEEQIPERRHTKGPVMNERARIGLDVQKDAIEERVRIWGVYSQLRGSNIARNG